ncbi:LysR substrate-binding domain-containing protein [Winogradskyella maritima]|nr:LysR substrate-binding domain-containing protein [Winogradskyella maritima]
MSVTRKSFLTPAGHYLKKEVIFIFNYLEKVERQLKLVGDGNSGELRIGFLGSAMQEVIPKLLLKIKEVYPNVKSSLEELTNTAQVDAVLNDRLDMGFVRLSRVPNTLRMETVFKDTFSLVLPERYPMITRELKVCTNLAMMSLYFLVKRIALYIMTPSCSICQDAGFVPKVSHKSVHAHTILSW